MSEYFSNLAEITSRKMMITTCNLEKEYVKQIDLICRAKGISRSEFIREAVKLALKDMHSSSKRGWIYVMYSERLSSYKIGRTKDINETVRIYWGGREIPGKKEKIHTFETLDMFRAETIIHRHFKHKRLDDSELFDLNEDDVSWIKEGRYKELRDFDDLLI